MSWTDSLIKNVWTYGWTRWYRIMSRDRTPPNPVTSLRFVSYKRHNMWSIPLKERRKKMARLAEVGFVWEPSVSTDVKGQEVVVSVNEEPLDVLELPSTVSEYTISELLHEGDRVHVEITVVDFAGNKSVPTGADFVVPDMTAPAPVGVIEFFVTPVDDVE